MNLTYILRFVHVELYFVYSNIKKKNERDKMKKTTWILHKLVELMHIHLYNILIKEQKKKMLAHH